MSNLPIISCLCPTFRRPRLLQNTIACFLAQDYPADRRELLILDDDGAYNNVTSTGVKGYYRVISVKERYPTLTAKYNALASQAVGTVFAVWEDDDIYLPWHLSANTRCMGSSIEVPWLSKMSQIYSTYGNKLQIEDSQGRFHASLVFNRSAFNTVGGWPNTKRADFDQQLIQSLQNKVSVCDPIKEGVKPSYCFTWETSQDYHGQSFMRSPEDETWYDRGATEIQVPSEYPSNLSPQFVPETLKVFNELGITKFGVTI